MFKPAMKGRKSWKSPTWNVTFLQKKKKAGNEKKINKVTNLNLLMLGFLKKNVGKIADFGLQFSIKVLGFKGTLLETTFQLSKAT